MVWQDQERQQALLPFQREADAFANDRCAKALTRPANRAKPHMCSKEAEARLARVAALIDKNAIVLGAETPALVLWAGCSGRVFFAWAAPLGQAALVFW